LYVLSLDAADQRVVVGPRSALERTTLTASSVNWMTTEPPGPLRVAAQIRHRHQPAPATVRPIGAGGSPRGARAALRFDAPQIAVTPGQAVVFYQDDVVVGGGWID
jgi:tRNA-specific 2-thiouridylase